MIFSDWMVGPWFLCTGDMPWSQITLAMMGFTGSPFPWIGVQVLLGGAPAVALCSLGWCLDPGGSSSWVPQGPGEMFNLDSHQDWWPPPGWAVRGAIFNLWGFFPCHGYLLVQNMQLLRWEGMVQSALVKPCHKMPAWEVVWQFPPLLSFKTFFKLLTVLSFDCPFAHLRDNVNCDSVVAEIVTGYLSPAVASWHL